MLKTSICDPESRKAEDVNIAVKGYDIEIFPKACGTYASRGGAPIILELHHDKLRLVVWADINQEDPTHIIDLEGARESNRKPLQ